MDLGLSGEGGRRLVRCAIAALVLVTVWGCSDDGGQRGLTGLSVEVANTFESDDQTGGDEVPFGEPEEAVVGPDIEFAPFILYDIDISDGEISMNYAGGEELARVIEAGTVDRYRFTFSEDVLDEATADDTAALVPRVIVESPTTLLVEIGEGMEIGDGFGAVVQVTTR
jgi:hypothetical protein